jgi:hypothetical protein
MPTPLEAAAKLYAFNQGYCHRLVADLTDEQMARQPAPGMNTPLWLLGHLTLTTDGALRLLGRPPACPKAWAVAFSPRTQPAASGDGLPGKAELLTAYDAGHAAVTAALPGAAAEQLDAANPFEFARAMFPTAGDLLMHLLTTHEAGHLGQLSAWRRVMGLPAV